ncbi:MAG: type II toxin-antitoxin system VapC family toxin [Acidobacteria bacterium]|nr:type II toxin-antitoxin system VapC family toxin [Acidobacteriota bacterium]
MAIYLLDSDVIIDVLNHKRGRRELLRDLAEERHVLACCSIQVTEVYTGTTPEEEARTEELLAGLEFYEVTQETARKAGRLRRDYARRGVTLSLADVTIAAVALSHQLTLITDNVKDYPMPELKLYR